MGGCEEVNLMIVHSGTRGALMMYQNGSSLSCACGDCVSCLENVASKVWESCIKMLTRQIKMWFGAQKTDQSCRWEFVSHQLRIESESQQSRAYCQGESEKQKGKTMNIKVDNSCDNDDSD